MICHDTMSHINVNYLDGIGWQSEAVDIFGGCYDLDVELSDLDVIFSLRNPDYYNWQISEGVESWANNDCGSFMLNKIMWLDTLSELARAMNNADRVRSMRAKIIDEVREAVNDNIRKETQAVLNVLSLGEKLGCR